MEGQPFITVGLLRLSVALGFASLVSFDVTKRLPHCADTVSVRHSNAMQAPMAKQYQTAIIIVTHDEKIIPTFKRLYNIRDGRTIEEAGEGRSIS